MTESELLHRVRIKEIEELFTPEVAVNAATLRQQIEAILKHYLLLSDHGYGSYPTRKGMQGHQAARAALLEPDSVETIAELCEWIREFLRERININYKRNSYELKHIAEREVGYVTNGQMIVGMLLCGFKMGKEIVGVNPSFNVSTESIEDAIEASRNPIQRRK